MMMENVMRSNVLAKDERWEWQNWLNEFAVFQMVNQISFSHGNWGFVYHRWPHLNGFYERDMVKCSILNVECWVYTEHTHRLLCLRSTVKHFRKLLYYRNSHTATEISYQTR